MDRSLYVGMTGASQIMAAQAVMAQNLANVSTNGFRADLHAMSAVPIVGPGFGTRVNAVADSSGFSTEQGALSQTGAPLDVAVLGKGWLAVQAKDGSEAYTRAGDLHLDPDGVLMTATGLPVLGDGGPITVPLADTVSIGSDGTITIVPQGIGAKGASAIGRLKLVNPPEASLVKGVDGLIRTRDGQPAPADAAVQVQSGAIEASNVNAPRALVEMIELARLFDMNTRLMSTVDQNGAAAQKLLSAA
ncbi:MAG: flagellar basal-body rod protein FlgF [Proteobacteria bacterium]|nr:flagellar basal-body rod protein FlgF [Pseudomonadota bacterium]